MKFGIFWQVPGYEGSSVSDRHWETIDEIELADDIGFSQAWLAESPFYPTRPMSQPLLVASAAGQRTKNIRFGTLAAQIPLHHPVDYASTVATCDILTNGRFDLCVGGRFGGKASQVVGISEDIDNSQSRRMVSEYVDILRKSWTNDRLTYKGEYWGFEDVPVIPKPIQKPYPTLLMAANSDSSFEFAASQGMGVIGTMLSQPLGNLKIHSDTFHRVKNNLSSREVAQPFHIAISFFVAETREKAHAIMKDNWRDSDVIGDGPPVHSSAIGGGRHDFSSGAGGWATWDFKSSLKHCIYDSPEGCIERLAKIVSTVDNVDQVILEFNRRGRIPSDMVKKSMELFGNKVLPSLS